MGIENSILNISLALDREKKIMLSQKYFQYFRVKISCLDNAQLFKREKKKDLFLSHMWKIDSAKNFFPFMLNQRLFSIKPFHGKISLSVKQH